MNTEKPSSPRARQTAEQILQAIYGEDFAGCAISLDALAKIINQALQDESRVNVEIIDSLKKVIEAVQVFSTPPQPGEVKDSKHLQEVLGHRLDSIREISDRIISTLAPFPPPANGRNDEPFGVPE